MNKAIFQGELRFAHFTTASCGTIELYIDIPFTLILYHDIMGIVRRLSSEFTQVVNGKAGCEVSASYRGDYSALDIRRHYRKCQDRQGTKNPGSRFDADG
jgi:hypothetical protein